MRIKVCGLTRAEDAQLAESLGAWALGFVFYKGSPRYVAPDVVAGFSFRALKTGVFVNQTEEALIIAKQAGLRALQLHGAETPEECRRAREAGIVIKAFRLKTESDLAAIPAYRDSVDYILVDAAVDGQWGGTGKTSDWALAARAKDFGIPLVLAGGLGADNAARAVEEVQPFALDMSGSLESAPGIKDHEKMRALFTALKGKGHGNP